MSLLTKRRKLAEVAYKKSCQQQCNLPPRKKIRRETRRLKRDQNYKNEQDVIQKILKGKTDV